jgi:hypothetical protein
LSKHFYIEQEREQLEQDNRLLQRQRKPQFVYTETGPTSCTLKGQFVKPGVIDHRYRTSATALHSLGLSQTRTVGTPTVVSPIGANLGAQGVHVRESDRKGRDGVNPSSTLRHGNAPRISEYRGVDEAACPLATLAVVSPWDETAIPSSPLVTLTRQYLILLGVLLAEYRSTWFIHVLNGLLVPISFTFFVVAVGGVTKSTTQINSVIEVLLWQL